MAIACGANMNFDRLRFVAERAELGEAREAILAVTIPERPGSFREFCALLGKRSSPSSTTATPIRASRTSLRRHRGRQPPRDRAPAARELQAAPDRGLRPVRQRDGQAARAASGRRPRAGGGERNPLPLRVSRAAGRADALPQQHEPRLEHQPVPLPQPRRRLRARAGRHAGAARRTRREFRALPRRGSATTASTRRPIPPTGCSSGARRSVAWAAPTRRARRRHGSLAVPTCASRPFAAPCVKGGRGGVCPAAPRQCSAGKTCSGVAKSAKGLRSRFRQGLCSSQLASVHGKLAPRRVARNRHGAGAEWPERENTNWRSRITLVGRQGHGDRRFEHHSPQRRDLSAAGRLHGDPRRGRLRRAGQDRRPPAATSSSSTS